MKVKFIHSATCAIDRKIPRKYNVGDVVEIDEKMFVRLYKYGLVEETSDNVTEVKVEEPKEEKVEEVLEEKHIEEAPKNKMFGIGKKSNKTKKRKKEDKE